MNQRLFEYNRASEFIRNPVTDFIVTSYGHWPEPVAGCMVSPHCKRRCLIMPMVTNGNTNSPTLMITEKLSDAILVLPPLPRIEAEFWTHPEFANCQREFSPGRRRCR